MIVTLTANPSLDRTLHVDTLRLGSVNRALAVRSEPSGKGVNVSLALHTAGTPTTAVLPIGGPAGSELAGMLDSAGLPWQRVEIAGNVRSNVSLVEADGSTTKINEPGPMLSESEVQSLVDRAEAECGPGEWVAFCGSLPTGFAVDRLRSAVATARRSGLRVAVDTSEGALVELLAGRPEEVPDLVKPNVHELAAVTGRSLTRLGDVVAAAQVLLDRGIATVLVSLGGDGAVLLDADGASHGTARAASVVNTVGAGDAFLAGYLHARHRDDTDRLGALRSALTWGAIAVAHPGTVFPGLDPERTPATVQITAVDPDRVLSEPA